MAMRLERSGGLIFIRGGPDEPEPPPPKSPWGLVLWLVLMGLLGVVLFVGPDAPGWPMVNQLYEVALAAAG